ncbi:copper resistance protein CopC [Robertmurraya sp. DFI.2.37]|uniref:copper resistance CopC family protein n=1 Tax=Robertmurraya sp. DFI.2.37 TaxID=3031819 RepID=UPI001785D7EB|nr:copper resistance protein CopC [Robertmurraya sp. DFI.2.37]MDF1508997.1 copper resistance protein CopC [Robertmurraya sp. DFI.2.37]
MKRFFIALIAFLFVTSISNNAFAHSHLESSNPADGEVVTEALNEIVLDFDGGIEQGSFLEVTTTDGQAVELQDTLIDEDKLTAVAAETLTNGEYQVTWSVISADGHSLDGEFSFTVDAPEMVEEEVTEEDSGTETSEQSVDNEELDSTETSDEKESSSLTIVFVVLAIVLVAGGLIYFTKRKK